MLIPKYSQQKISRSYRCHICIRLVWSNKEIAISFKEGRLPQYFDLVISANCKYDWLRGRAKTFQRATTYQKYQLNRRKNSMHKSFCRWIDMDRNHSQVPIRRYHNDVIRLSSVQFVCIQGCDCMRLRIYGRGIWVKSSILRQWHRLNVTSR